MKLSYKLLVLTLFSTLFLVTAAEHPDVTMKKQPVKKVLFIGDSMTGWMAERLNAYGETNGFEVATVIWDGSTIKKWGSSTNLASLIESQDPDAVFLSLGLNELLERNPSHLNTYVDNILKAVGNRNFLWIGPPSWPGRPGGNVLNQWIEGKVGSDRFFNSLGLELKRQSANNPHPSRAGIIKWIDSVMTWIPDNTPMQFPGYTKPDPNRMSRGKVFIYKRMKENL